MKLVVGDLSTWSLRAWMCVQLSELKIEVQSVALGAQGYQQQLAQYSPSMLVPVLIDGDLVVHDSLAICEYLNELCGGRLYPSVAAERAQARSLLAELHSGFTHLRSTCPFTLDAVTAVDKTVDINKELCRLSAIFDRTKGAFMFSQPGAVDAFYAVMAQRLASYGVTLEGRAGDYQRSLLEWPLFKAAMQQLDTW